MSAARAALAGLALLAAIGCARSVPPAPAPATPARLRISELGAEGDARRRASLRLVSEGLASDAAGAPEQALGRYERAIQLDPTNPYVYLVLARYHVEAGDAQRALADLDQARVRFDTEGGLSPRVAPHLFGLRGAALQLDGRSDEASPLLARARALAPDVWSDGQLSPQELQ